MTAECDRPRCHRPTEWLAEGTAQASPTDKPRDIELRVCGYHLLWACSSLVGEGVEPVVVSTLDGAS